MKNKVDHTSKNAEEKIKLMLKKLLYSMSRISFQQSTSKLAVSGMEGD